MLRTPSSSPSVLAERERLVGLFEKDQGLAAALQGELVRLNRTVRVDELVRLLWGEPPEALPFPWVYPLLGVAAVLTLAAAVTIGKLWLLVMVAVLVVNSTIHFSTRARWQGELEALRFVAALLAAARRVGRLEAEGLADCRQRLAGAVRQTKPLAWQIAWLSSGALSGVLYEYLNMAFVLELQAYQRILARLPRRSPAARRLPDPGRAGCAARGGLLAWRAKRLVPTRAARRSAGPGDRGRDAPAARRGDSELGDPGTGRPGHGRQHVGQVHLSSPAGDQRGAGAVDRHLYGAPLPGDPAACALVDAGGRRRDAGQEPLPCRGRTPAHPGCASSARSRRSV